MSDVDGTRYEVELDEGYADNTRLSYLSDWKQFVAWCLSQGRVPLPATPETLCAYVEAHKERHRPATIARRMTALIAIHRSRDLHDPTDHRTVKSTMRRMWREKGRAQKQALAINFERRERMLSCLGARTIDFRDAAMLTLAYDTGCRRSELVSLDVVDFERFDDCSAAVIVRRSKTDQEGEGLARYVSPDTMLRIDRWMVRAEIEDGPLVPGSQPVRGTVLGQDWRRRSSETCSRKLARRSGEDADELVQGTTGHSGRVGMAQDMTAAGIDLAAVMQAGGWQTPHMVARYAKRTAVRLGAAARLAKIQSR